MGNTIDKSGNIIIFMIIWNLVNILDVEIPVLAFHLMLIHMEEIFHKPKQSYQLTGTLQSPSKELMIIPWKIYSSAMSNMVLHALLNRMWSK